MENVQSPRRRYLALVKSGKLTARELRKLEITLLRPEPPPPYIGPKPFNVKHEIWHPQPEAGRDIWTPKKETKPRLNR